MSAISGFINTIRNAVYGEQVRGAIISALEQCYSDVNAPSLQKEGFARALAEAYAGGILDIQTVTQISSMTNQAIIYRYNGTETGKQKGLYYYSPLSSSWVLIGSEIHAVSTAAQMTDTNAIYKYTGTQTGYVQNSLYCYNGTSWVPIGSGVLTASTAALMTNTGAIYKYTGTEAGMIQNALYYYDGTTWKMVGGGVLTAQSTSGMVSVGSLYRNTENGKLYYYNGTNWEDLATKQELDDGVHNASQLPIRFVNSLINYLQHVSGTFDDANGAEYIDAIIEALGQTSGITLQNGVLSIISSVSTLEATQNGSVLTIS